MSEIKSIKSLGCDHAKVIQVIETQATRGAGTEDDPVRIVIQYWDFDGNHLAENDPAELLELL